jgi:UDP-N-acetylmuramoyl-tripeptide--D-alanyl-D-alanine ligase
VFTREELLEAVEGEVVGGELPPRFPGAAIDSRQVREGELFVALRGAALDGHRFIGAAVAAGAAAVLCACPDPEALARGVAQVVVPNPLPTLQELARRHLARQPYTRVVGVAGSNGKTSVKEATAALLAHLGPTLKTTGNLNTETGVPVSLLRLESEHRFAVIEMGAQVPGEVALLCRVAPPQIGVVTVVGPEHLEFFGSMENVIQAEGEIVEALPADALAILNADDLHVRGMARRTPARVQTYGRAARADVRALRVTGDTLHGLRFTLAFEGERARVHLGLPGEHAVTTALAAAAVALACGMRVSAAAAALAEIRPVKRRGEIKRGVNGSTLVDDSYNANRQSAVASLATLRGARLCEGGRRWFVFGDMLELGGYSPDEHAGVGMAAASIGLDELVLVGADVRATAAAALAAGMPPERVHLFAAPLEDHTALAHARLEAALYVRERLRPCDVALVKGSLGVGMDAIVAELLARDDPLPRTLARQSVSAEGIHHHHVM